MILVIDNYDSFVFNLARYFAELGCETRVVRNDEWTVKQVIESRPTAIVLSPGPCTPAESGICIELLRELRGDIPVLGVCLGHQAIVAAFGGSVVRAPTPMHGRTSVIEHQGTAIFTDIPQRFRVTRYHSLIASEQKLPDVLQVTAATDEGLIMAIEHQARPFIGVQFHPESVLTEFGPQLLSNFLSINGITANGECFGDAIRVEACGPWLASELPNEAFHWDQERDGDPLHW